ncbi:MAG: carboxymuconolactone decarboxylase family protein [Novosphingobium sp.]
MSVPATSEFIGGDPARPLRMPGLPREQWTRPVLDFFARMEGPTVYEQGGTKFNAPPLMAHHLPLFNAWLDYNQFLSSDQLEIPVTLREIAVLRIAWHKRAGYEWYQHRVIGRRAGLSEEQLAAVSVGTAAAVWTDSERLAVRLADEIHANDRILPNTLDEAARHFGPRKLLELMWAIGTYGMLAWMFNSLEMPIEDFALEAGR